MNFNDLQRHVQHAEATVELRARQTVQHWNALDAAWRRCWTPGRIVIAGLAGGFVAGKLEPGGAFSGARWLQMIGSVSGLLDSARDSIATLQESGLADLIPGMTAGKPAAQENGRHASAAPSPEPATHSPPRPAEAATELSEH